MNTRNLRVGSIVVGDLNSYMFEVTEIKKQDVVLKDLRNGNFVEVSLGFLKREHGTVVNTVKEE